MKTDEELYLAGDFQALVDRHSADLREMLADCCPAADADQAIRQGFADLRLGPPEVAPGQLRPWLFSRVHLAAIYLEAIQEAVG